MFWDNSGPRPDSFSPNLHFCVTYPLEAVVNVDSFYQIVLLLLCSFNYRSESSFCVGAHGTLISGFLFKNFSLKNKLHAEKGLGHVCNSMNFHTEHNHAIRTWSRKRMTQSLCLWTFSCFFSCHYSALAFPKHSLNINIIDEIYLSLEIYTSGLTQYTLLCLLSFTKHSDCKIQLLKNWSISDLLHCVRFRYTAKQFSYTYVHNCTFFSIIGY